MGAWSACVRPHLRVFWFLAPSPPFRLLLDGPCIFFLNCLVPFLVLIAVPHFDRQQGPRPFVPSSIFASCAISPTHSSRLVPSLFAGLGVSPCTVFRPARPHSAVHSATVTYPPPRRAHPRHPLPARSLVRTIRNVYSPSFFYSSGSWNFGRPTSNPSPPSRPSPSTLRSGKRKAVQI